MTTETLTWNSEAPGTSWASTVDGYRLGVGKVRNNLLGYLASVETPNWTYTGSFETMASAKQWCRHIMVRDRKEPLKRG